MTTVQLKNKLTERGYNETTFKGMGKADLEEMLNSLEILDQVQEVKEPLIPFEKPPIYQLINEGGIPLELSPTSVGWSDYVISKFDEKEMDKGSPRVDGLRRVAELLLGPFNIRTLVVQPPTLDSGATVVVSLEFSNGRKVDGAADVNYQNTTRQFAMHAVATAETRAEGRALRKALRLTKVLAAEELQTPDKDESPVVGQDGLIQQEMLNSLQMMAAKQSIDISRLVKYIFDCDDPRELKRSQGLKLSDVLFDYKQKKTHIPEEVLK